MFRFLFPSFEKPVERPRYLNIEPEARDFRGIGTVLLLAASCGVALALWEPSQRITSPFATASMSRPAPAEAVKTAAGPETTAAADDIEDDQPVPTVKLTAFCSQRTTARRDCASVKAFKDARLKAPEPVAEPVTEKTQPVTEKAQPAVAETQPATPPAAKVAASESAEAVPAVVQPEAAPPQRPVAAPKVKRARVTEAPVEKLVKIYDQVLPDGRRVPVYRRVGSGGYETGTIVDGEYRPTRRAHLEPPAGRFFGLQ